MSDGLPPGWTKVTLAEVAEHSLGKMLDRAKHTEGVRLPYLRNVNVQWGRIDTHDVLEMFFRADQFDRFGLKPGDLLVCEGGEPGRCAIWDGRDDRMRYQKALHRVRPGPALEARFLRDRLALDAWSGRLADYFTGTTIKHFTGKAIHRYEFPLAPVNEQRRIVEKIDALMARSRRAKEALDAIPPLLERFRQSILAAAFRGDLTADWRAQNPKVEPADKLLERIRTERRHHWEQAYLAKQRAKGKEPENDKWKAKYKEPEAADASDLPQIPHSWEWVTAEECAWEITVGHVGPMRSKYVESGILFLRSQNVRENRFNSIGLKFIATDFHKKLSKSVLRPGDVIVVRSGAPGTACVVPAGLGDANCADLVIVRLLHSLDSYILSYYINSPAARARVRGEQVGVAQQHFNVGSMKKKPVPLMPAAEQAELRKRIETALAKIELAAEAFELGATRAAGLNQSVLAKAFRGELVPQDPTDEPASVLLEHIRAQRADEAGKKKARSRARRAK